MELLTYSEDQKPAQRLSIDHADNIMIFAPLEWARMSKLQQVPGASFSKLERIWRVRYTLDNLRRVLEILPNTLVSPVLALKAKCDEELLVAEESLPRDYPQPDWVAVELFPFQREGVALLKDLPAAFLCDEMGLGKTVQAIAWASYLNRVEKAGRVIFKGTIVLCPASVKYNWRQEIKRARPDDIVVVVDSENRMPEAGEADWIVINYDLISANQKRVAHFKNLLQLMKFRAHNIILDESHYIKNREALRTRAALKLCASVPRKLMVTGTPLLNRPVELWTQLIGLGRAVQADFYSWAARYCGAKQLYIGRGRFVWDYSGASNTDELHSKLKPFFVRRLKKDVLKQLPPIRYTDTIIPLPPKIEKEYRLAEEDFVKWSVEHGRAVSEAIHLTRLMALQQIALEGKVPLLVEKLLEYVDEQKKAIVFCSFLERGINPLQDALKKAGVTDDQMIRLTGAEDPLTRQQSIDKFQKEPTCLFALCSTTAAGVGVNLTASDTVIFLDLPWTPGVKDQAEARAHRIGQESGVVVEHFLAQDTIDELKAKVLKQKGAIISKVVDGTGEVTKAEVLMEVERLMAASVAKRKEGK